MASSIFTYNPLALELAGTTTALLLFFWLPSCAYLLILYLFPNFSQKYKTQPSEPLPTRQELVHCAAIVLRNQLLGITLQTAVHIVTLHFFGVPPYRIFPPSVLKVARDLALCIPLCEITFYFLHQLLHKPALYRRIHKTHHSFTAPVALAAQYSHPIEYVLTCYLPIMLPPVVVRANVVSLWAFVGMVGFESCTVHSGFRMGRLAEKHDRHHEGGVQGGYGTFDFLDWLFGTEMRSMRAEKKRMIEVENPNDNL
ncbi:fatty acid hydroxylase [Wilcoxina mikolae CBS 423.85]|nr:fatty acid hydroxylase [Wilcoxina mikolae CBS 423.85]